jgi:Rps23 Pro-64 3,4-dihydroxylase Tpa1-like proline 4-hydroxylase
MENIENNNKEKQIIMHISKPPNYISTNNCVFIYNNVLSDILLKECINYSNECIKNNFYSTTNILSWDKNITGNSNEIKVIKLDEENEILKKKICYELKNKFNFYTEGIKVNLNIMQEGCYINEHYDSHVEFAFTIYLNEIWGKDDGGIFQFDIGDIVHDLIPTYNTMVILKNNIHRVTKINSKKLRITIQGFYSHSFYYKNKPIELLL